MSMVGRGGGNFFTTILIISGLTVYQAACTSQFILVVAAAGATLIFHKKKLVDIRLALLLGIPTQIMAFFGGMFSGQFNPLLLEILLVGLIFLAGSLMLIPIGEERLKTMRERNGIFFRYRNFGGYDYTIDLRYGVPVTILTGFFAGMIGISGGSFLIPLMVLLCGVPMKIAVGTSAFLVSLTALMGFLGHLSAGHFEWRLAVPAAAAGLVGGIIGGKFSIRINPRRLKIIFGVTTLLAGCLMIWKIVH